MTQVTLLRAIVLALALLNLAEAYMLRVCGDALHTGAATLRHSTDTLREANTALVDLDAALHRCYAASTTMSTP